jgi:putative transposase
VPLSQAVSARAIAPLPSPADQASQIRKLMRNHGLRALAGRKFKPCTTDSRHDLAIAPNLLEQEFGATVPNQIWLAAITYFPTGEGWLYQAAVLDVATRKIVGCEQV